MLEEVDYSKIFSPKTMDSLKGKSGESLRQMLGNKTLMQTLRKTGELLNELMEAEYDYRKELADIAIEMCKEAYPVLGYNDIKIIASINPDIDSNMDFTPPEESTEDKNYEMQKAKRRIINGITQGASIRGAFAFLLFKEYLDIINPILYDKYNEIMKLVFGIFDDENAIAMMLAQLAQEQKMQGGESDIEYDEEEEQFIIKATGLCFPMLVHEIVKGLYEIVGTKGFGEDPEKNKQIVGQVDKVSNEPEDSRYGKFIYDGINNLYIDSGVDDARVRELLFSRIYKLPEKDFLGFIENIINETITPNQKAWVERQIKEIQSNLHDDDRDDVLPPNRDEDDEDSADIY